MGTSDAYDGADKNIVLVSLQYELRCLGQEALGVVFGRLQGGARFIQGDGQWHATVLALCVEFHPFKRTSRLTGFRTRRG